jgi:hypothetical protein
MNISEVIANYFHDVSWSKWDLNNCLKTVIKTCEDITSEDCEKIKTELRSHLNSISSHNSMSKKVRNKASKLTDELDRFFQSKKVKTILDEKNMKVSASMYFIK